LRYLLDTCVISELVARRPAPSVVSWIDGVEPDSVYLPVFAIGEIRKGIEKLQEPGRKAALQAWLRDELLVRFQDRTAMVDTEVILRWGELVGRLEVQGTPMSLIDSLIAATALQGDFVLATRNEDDFRRSGVRILNPWKTNAT